MSTVASDEHPLVVERLPLARVLDALGTIGCERVLEPGAPVWDAPRAEGEVAIVLEGGVEIDTAPDAGPARRLGPGMALLVKTGAPPCAARAAVASRVLLLAEAPLRAFLRANPDLLEELFWQQLRSVREAPGSELRSESLDAVTGLHSHAFLLERLSLEIGRARLTGDTVSVVLFEVDRLAALRASHGSERAEDVLRMLGALLRRTGRRADVAARVGDSEMATVLYGATASDAWRFAEAFRGSVMATGVPSEFGPPRRVTVSAGVASCPQDARDDLALLAVARARVDAARQAGGNCSIGATARSS